MSSNTAVGFVSNFSLMSTTNSCQIASKMISNKVS